MAYDILLFDLDGTVTDPAEGITKCVRCGLDACGFPPVPLKDLLCFIGPPLHRQYMEYAGFDRATADLAVAAYRQRYESTGIFENKIYPGMPELLRDLRAAGRTVVMATCKPEPFARQILQHFGVFLCFNEVVGSGMDGTRAEKGEVIAEAFARLSFSDADRPRMLMIGDRKMDAIGARENGIACLGVGYGYAPPGELEAEGVMAIMPTVADLRRYLLG